MKRSVLLGLRTAGSAVAIGRYCKQRLAKESESGRLVPLDEDLEVQAAFWVVLGGVTTLELIATVFDSSPVRGSSFINCQLHVGNAHGNKQTCKFVSIHDQNHDFDDTSKVHHRFQSAPIQQTWCQTIPN